MKRPDSYNYQRGLEAFDAEDYDEAFNYFTKELNDNPKNGYAHTLIALIYYMNDEYGKALNSADQAIKYLPKKDTEYQESAHITKAGTLLELEDTTAAIATLSSAIKNFPKESILYEKRAEIYFAQEQYNLADADYRKMIELSPGETTGYMGLGRNAIALDRWEDAIKQFNYVTKLSSSYSAGYSFRAEAYMGLKKWDEATDDIVTSLQCDYDQKAVYLSTILEEPAFSMLISKFKVQSIKSPNDVKWHTLMGFMYENKDQYEKAIDCYNAANNKDMDEAILYRIANCYYSMGNLQQALNSINQALNMDSTDVEDMAVKSDILHEMGDHLGAIALADKVLAQVPEYARGYYHRGRYKRAAGDTINAIEDLSMAIVLDPKTSWYYYTRGDIYLKQGKKDLAEADFRKVIELEAKPEDYQCIPYAYLGLGEYEKAIAAVDSTIKLDSTDASAYYNGACLYSRMNNQPKSIEFLRKSLEYGYKHFGHISQDADLDNVRDCEEFKALIREFNNNVDDTENMAFGMKDNEIRHKTDELLKRLQFTEHKNDLVESLPLGWKQKLAFSVSIFHEPGVVFLDEPTGGVDPATRRQFWELIYDAAERGITVFVTTHYMDEAEYCNRISIMVDGKISAIGTPEELKERFNQPDMDHVFTYLARQATRSTA